MQIHVTSTSTNTVVYLAGTLRGGAKEELKALLVDLKTPKVTFDCQQLNVIDSRGAGDWATFLRSLMGKAEISYQNCSVTFIDYANLIPAFLGIKDIAASKAVRSFDVPYHCETCRKTFESRLEIDEVLPQKVLPDRGCPKCGSACVPEVNSEDYLSFLNR